MRDDGRQETARLDGATDAARSGAADPALLTRANSHAPAILQRVGRVQPYHLPFNQADGDLSLTFVALTELHDLQPRDVVVDDECSPLVAAAEERADWDLERRLVAPNHHAYLDTVAVAELTRHGD